MDRLTPAAAIAGVALLGAGVLAYLATRSAGPVPMPAFTEQRGGGPLMEHLITEAELISSPVYVPHHYPPRVAHGISQVVSHGFSPLYQAPDPQVAALPAEEAW